MNEQIETPESMFAKLGMSFKNEYKENPNFYTEEFLDFYKYCNTYMPGTKEELELVYHKYQDETIMFNGVRFTTPDLLGESFFMTMYHELKNNEKYPTAETIINLYIKPLSRVLPKLYKANYLEKNGDKIKINVPKSTFTLILQSLNFKKWNLIEPFLLTRKNQPVKNLKGAFHDASTSPKYYHEIETIINNS